MIKIWILGLGALCAAGCATPSRFEWGGYENGLYAYAKSPDTRENYRKVLVNAIAVGEKTKRLAPGMYAELGYLSLEDGDTAAAVANFQKEMQAFPEARPFLTRTIDRLTNRAVAVPTGVATFPAAAPVVDTPAS